MRTKSVFLITVLCVYNTVGEILFWSNHKIEISPFTYFNDESLEELSQALGYPEIRLYKTYSSLLPEFKNFLSGYYTAYTPNGEINIENATEIASQEDLSNLDLGRKHEHILSVVIIPSSRQKREVTASNLSSSAESTTPIVYKTYKGAVLYKGKFVGKTKKDVYGMLYSSQPLLLKTNFSTHLLGRTKADMVQVDTKGDIYTRLNVKIQVEEDYNLITLRFIFSWTTSGYWSLDSVKISDTNNLYAYELNITQKFGAPAHFSYHCANKTVFRDSSNSVELYIYDMQAQIDSTNGKFSDAYDCIDFTTGPILSGLFVTAILGVGLVIALIALSEIKTMDKFDSQKTKQMVVTVSE